jgi:hypothetical protein
MLLNGTINQTGTSTSIVRGLYVNPTLTAAADWRSIEWSNNSGWGLYGAGTANNYLNGGTAIGTTTLGTATKLTIGGSETASSAIARGTLINTSLTAAANNDVLVGLDVAPTFTNGAFTGVSNIGLRVGGTSGLNYDATNQRLGIGTSTPTQKFIVRGTSSTNASVSVSSGDAQFNVDRGTTAGGAYFGFSTNAIGSPTWQCGMPNSSTDLVFGDNNFANIRARIFQSTGNIGINQATDAGFRLDVNGTARVQGELTVSASNSTNTFTSQNSVSSTIFYGNASGSGTVAFELANLSTRRFRILCTSTNTTFEASNQTGSFVFNNRVSLPASSTTKSSLNIASGTAPTSPNDGDIWFDGTKLSLRISSTTNAIITENIPDAINISVGTTTGTKIGTATTQKLSFWNATPIVQPTTAVAEAAFVENSGGTVVNVDSTFDGYTMQQVVKALRNAGLLA